MKVATLRSNAKRVRLKNMRPGLFLSNCGELCLRTEYGEDAYIVSSGEYFWGGAQSKEARREILVTPVRVGEPA